MAEHDQNTDPQEGRRALLSRLYSPYTYLVYFPAFGVSTLAFGSVARVVALASPRAAFHVGTAWAWLLCRLNFTKVNVRGREHLDAEQSYVIMSNHQSHFDVLAFYGHWFGQFRWVMKEELRKAPGLGSACEDIGHIFIDRSSPQAAIASLRTAKRLLQGGISVMIFPEGTRSSTGRLLPFKKGGFMTALSLELPILPVSISGSRRVLPNHTFELLPGEIEITIHPPIDTAAYGVKRRDELMEEVRQSIASGLTPWERDE